MAIMVVHSIELNLSMSYFFRQKIYLNFREKKIACHTYRTWQGTCRQPQGPGWTRKARPPWLGTQATPAVFPPLEQRAATPPAVTH